MYVQKQPETMLFSENGYKTKKNLKDILSGIWFHTGNTTKGKAESISL